MHRQMTVIIHTPECGPVPETPIAHRARSRETATQPQDCDCDLFNKVLRVRTGTDTIHKPN